MDNENKEQSKIKNDYLTPKDVAKKLQLSHTTVTKLMKVKGFPATRVGRSIRIDEKQLDEFLASYRSAKINI